MLYMPCSYLFHSGILKFRRHLNLSLAAFNFITPLVILKLNISTMCYKIMKKAELIYFNLYSRCIIKVYGAVGIATGGVGDCTTEGVGVRVPVG
jgi:hypothetical protein